MDTKNIAPKVLLIDDNQQICNSFMLSFKKDFDIDCMTDLKKIKNIIKHNYLPYDFILLDILLDD